MSRLRLLVGVFLVSALVVICGLAADAAETVADPDPARFEAAIRKFESWDRQNSAPRDAALFVGSSSIRMWPTAESFPELPVINRGFGGSHVSDVNHFAERIVLKYAPQVIVLYAGDNDIAAKKPPRQVVAEVQVFVDLVHRRLPDTHIIFLPIKPSPSRWHVWPQMREANAAISELCEGDERFSYVDTATPMLGPDGRPRPELFVADQLHLDADGYALWTGILRPALRSIVEAK